MNRTRHLLVLIALALAAGVVPVDTRSQDAPGRPPTLPARGAKEAVLTPGIYARFSTTEGDFTVRLFDKDAPKTVANFVGLADGTIDPATGKPGKSKPF